MREKKKFVKNPNQLRKGRYYNLWCSRCRNHTLHHVEDKNPTQHIKCEICSQKREDKIENKRVKVKKEFGDLYADRNRTAGETEPAVKEN